MIFYNLTTTAEYQASIASYSNRTKVFNAVQFILQSFDNVEFVGIFDFNKTKKVNHKNLSIAISLLNNNESFGLRFTSDQPDHHFDIDITKMQMNPANDSIMLPIKHLQK